MHRILLFLYVLIYFCWVLWGHAAFICFRWLYPSWEKGNKWLVPSVTSLRMAHRPMGLTAGSWRLFSVLSTISQAELYSKFVCLGSFIITQTKLKNGIECLSTESHDLMSYRHKGSAFPHRWFCWSFFLVQLCGSTVGFMNFCVWGWIGKWDSICILHIAFFPAENVDASLVDIINLLSPWEWYPNSESSQPHWSLWFQQASMNYWLT